jgi:hypothetical protein
MARETVIFETPTSRAISARVTGITVRFELGECILQSSVSFCQMQIRSRSAVKTTVTNGPVKAEEKEFTLPSINMLNCAAYR